MASRLPGELIEHTLSLAYDPPSSDDVDIGLEENRRALLRACALVSHSWRLVASAMLPESLLVRSGAELEAHRLALAGGRLVTDRTTAFTVGDVHLSDEELASLHALASAAGGLKQLRLRHGSTIYRSEEPWPGQHLLVDDLSDGEDGEEYPDRLIGSLMARSAMTTFTLRRSTLFLEGGFIPFPDPFVERVTSLQFGAPAHHSDLLDCDIATTSASHLVSLSLYVSTFEAGHFSFENINGTSGRSRLPRLRTLRIGIVGGDLVDGVQELEDESTALAALLTAVPLSVTRVTLELFVVPSMGCALADFARWNVRVLALALGGTAVPPRAELVLDVVTCGVSDVWGSLCEGGDLASACAARNVSLFVRT